VEDQHQKPLAGVLARSSTVTSLMMIGLGTFAPQPMPPTNAAEPSAKFLVAFKRAFLFGYFCATALISTALSRTCFGRLVNPVDDGPHLNSSRRAQPSGG
jgi:hypothetical protein